MRNHVSAAGWGAVVVAALVAASGAPVAYGESWEYWEGTINNDFHRDGNWFGLIPDADAHAIVLNSTGEIYLSAFATCRSLWLEGSDLRTNGWQLNVREELDIVNGRTLTIENDAVTAGTLYVYDGWLIMEDGVVSADEFLNNGFVFGNGSITAMRTSGTALNNWGTIRVEDGDLELYAPLGGGLDLDGGDGSGVLDVTEAGRTLFVDGPLTDGFSGSLYLGDGSKAEFAQGFELSYDGYLRTYAGGVAPELAGDDVVLDGQIAILGDAKFSAPVTFTSLADLSVVGELKLTGGTTYAGCELRPEGEISQNSTAVVSAPSTLAASIVDLDGDNGETSWLITDHLHIQADTIDETSDTFHGTIRIDRGELYVDVLDNEWIMAGTLSFTSTFAGSNEGAVSGNPLRISGLVDVNDQQHRIYADTTFTASATVDIEAGAFLWMEGETTYLGGTYTGAGSLKHPGDVFVLQDVTLATGNVGFTGVVKIENGGTLSLASDTLGADNDILQGTFALRGGTLSVDNDADFWTLGVNGRLEFEQGGSPNQLAGEPVLIAGDIDVVSGVQNSILPEIQFQPTTQVDVQPAARLRLQGLTTYAGGLFTGGGELQQDGPARVTADANVATGIFDMDGVNELTTWTITGGAILTIDAGQLDDANNRFDGSLTLSTAGIDVETDNGQWRMSGLLTSTGVSLIGGQTVIFDDAIRVNSGALGVVAPATFDGPDVEVAAGAFLTLNATTYQGGAYTGAGAIVQAGAAQVAANTTIDVANYDWDGIAAATNVAGGVTFTINSLDLDDDAGHDGLITLDDAARLEVNTPGGWAIDSGTLRLGGPGATVAGSADLFVVNSAGRIEGNGQIATNVLSAGVTAPGLSAGALEIAGNFGQLPTGRFLVELGGSGNGQYDRLSVAGLTLLSGVLEISLIDGFVPGEGDVFRVLDFGSRNGEFTYVVGADFGVGDGEFLAAIYRDDHLTLYRPLPGDANLDGEVSGADFTIWADNFGAGSTWETADFTGDHLVTGADFTIWADNFGRVVSLDPPSAAAVPEPAGWLLAFAGGLLLALRGRRLV